LILFGVRRLAAAFKVRGLARTIVARMDKLEKLDKFWNSKALIILTEFD
jgi:hypothetical protein